MAARLTNEDKAFLVLNGLPKVGPVLLRRLLERFGNDPCAVFGAPKDELLRIEGIGNQVADFVLNWDRHFDLQKEENHIARYAVRFINFRDECYPRLLKETYDPPIGLYHLGEGRIIDRPAIAIVGTRRPTLYGRGVARRLAAELAQRGFWIISGMARGIDTEAHEGALSVKGRTAAVLGCGIDIIYPPENLDLYRKISESGLILSEFPFGRRADRQSFPMRNRVVSGLSVAVVVVESGASGGSMITARFAGEQGRGIFAVPGRIDQAASAGCHQLLRDGATLLTCVGDIIEEIQHLQLNLDFDGLNKTGKRIGSREMPEDLSPSQRNLMKCFKEGDLVTPDGVREMTGLSPSEVASGLMLLEIRGLLAKRADGRFEALG